MPKDKIPGLDITGLFPDKEEDFKEGYDFIEMVKHLKSIDETLKKMLELNRLYVRHEGVLTD